ncbi:MAG TPA: hypothetical protein VFA10_16730 [Ktedonobacteraceae bacterium]|nr:hypothetical protein [Ktedonobacteraceae bacterium]
MTTQESIQEEVLPGQPLRLALVSSPVGAASILPLALLCSRSNDAAREPIG